MHPVYLHIKKTLKPYYPAEEVSAIAKWILTDVFHFSVSELYAGKDKQIPKNDARKLEDILNRLLKYEPLQYIVEECRFGGLAFRVAPGVLIPRPETEELVDWICSDCAGREKFDILDIGTGSGCIAVTLAKRLPKASVASWDISDEALRIASSNAVSNGVDVDFRKVDVLSDDIPSIRTDVLVSNPPYVTEKERAEMEPNVLEWEPELALFVPDDDPLLFYRRIAVHGLRLLNKEGCLYFEINRAYGKETVDLLVSLGYQNVELRKDSFGNDRMVKGVRL